MTVRFLRPWWWLLDYLYAGKRQLLTPFRRRCPARFARGELSRPAIILVPGVYETWYFLEPIARRLNARGMRVFAVPELGFNRMPVPDSAARLATALDRLHVEHGLSRCILVAHSKGGLIGKQLMLADPGPIAIEGMVAVATPFAGSRYARYMLSRTLREFSPLDAALVALQGQKQVNERIVSVYGEFDPHIPSGSALEGARNVEVPVSGHFRILGSQAAIAAVERAALQWPPGARQ